MYEWIIDGISSLFVPFSGGKPRNGDLSEIAQSPGEQKKNCGSRPTKRNYQSVHLSEGTSEPVEIKRPRRDIILSTVKRTIAGVAGFLRLRQSKPSVQNDCFPVKKATPLVMAGIDELPNNNLSLWVMNGNGKIDKPRDGGISGQEKMTSSTGHFPLALSKKQEGVAMVFRGAQVRTPRRPLQLAPGHSTTPYGPTTTDPSSRSQKSCLTVEEALKESDREHYLRLVEMVSEKYSKAKPLPFAQTKPLITLPSVDVYKQTVFGRTSDTNSTKPTPLRANVFGWREGSSLKQPKERTLDMSLTWPTLECRRTGVVEQRTWNGKPVDLDLSEEVAARLQLKDKEPVHLSGPAGLQTRGVALPESRQIDEELPRLTKEMQQEVSAALAQRDPNLVLSSAFKLRITQRDLATLQESAWLNDEVINFYLNLLMSRSEQQQHGAGCWRKVYSFSTFFFPKLHGGGHAAVKRWTKVVDLFTYDVILVPLHLGVHWSLAVVDLKAKSVKSYDSMGQRHEDICNLILKYLKEEMKAKKDKELDLTKWAVSSLKAYDIPQQRNSNDCGVFVCKYADYISRGRPLTFKQCHMPHFRKLMIWEILNQRLL